MKNVPIIATIASTANYSIWSFSGPYNTYQLGYNRTITDPYLTALNNVFYALPRKPFLSAIYGRNVPIDTKLPITVQTSSQNFVDVVTDLSSPNGALVNASRLHEHLARRLQGFEITWELLDPTGTALTDLRMWREWQTRLVEQ